MRQASTAEQEAQDESLSSLDDDFIGLLGGPPGATALWLSKTAPYYTSYPPVTAFHEGVKAEDFAASINLISPNEPLSLYLHIPFCRELSLCSGYNTITRRGERVTRYLASVRHEIEILSSLIYQPHRISHLHFGGGAPNIMSGNDMETLFAALADRFDLSACHEIAMELDPSLVTTRQAQTLAACGVTRVSLDVQDFDANVQNAIQREQSFAVIAKACDDLRATGITSINIDLMCGLPFQTPATMADTAQQAISLNPNRIALFAYAHTPQMKKHQQALEALGLPDKHEQLALDRAARNVLTAAGYEEIGMDHFALPDDALVRAAAEGRLRRNFQGYTDDTASALLGIGASAISRTKSGYFQNEHDLAAYQDILQTDQLATARGILLTGEDRLRADLIETLMCTLSCDIDGISRKHNYSLAALTTELEALKPFEAARLLKREDHYVRLTSPHKMVLRAICQVFDRFSANANIIASPKA
jgi:oxygen-independent coproporphyrinogen-3 oxidase